MDKKNWCNEFRDRSKRKTASIILPNSVWVILRIMADEQDKTISAVVRGILYDAIVGGAEYGG